MEKNSKIYVAGHKGMVGAAILRKLQQDGFNNIITRTSSELDLTVQEDVRVFFKEEKPEYVFLAAAKVGGIYANDTYPADFIYVNIMIASNVIHSAYENNVKKLLFLGSACIYPKIVEQPIKEEYLLAGRLEKTNEAYAIAKIAGLKMCEYYNKQYKTDYISAMPTNLYGPGDNYHPTNSHVLPALIRKFHEAKERNDEEVIVWGTGTARREFLHVDDLAEACLFLMEHYSGDQCVNVGVGEDITIRELAEIIATTVGFEGKIIQDTSMPDGTPKRSIDCSKLFSMGWKPKIALKDETKTIYADYLVNRDNYRQ